MSIPTRNYIYGLSPLKRENPARGQSEWYYFDPRNASTFSDFKQIDVPSQNTPNPQAKEIQNYIFKTDPDNYKLLYGNAQPPQENQQNQPQQPENNTAKPIFSNQQNNQIFSQPQSTLGQAIGNNVEQSSQASVQNLNGTIKSTMPQATANAQNMNYIEQIKNILGDGGKDTQSILGTLPNIDNARSYTTDDGGIAYDVKPTIVHKEDKDNNEITAGLTYENYYKLLEHLRGIKNDKGDYVGGIEGYAGYPYLDTEGKNTVCTGNLIDENNTSKYPYTNIDTGKPATPEEIKQGYKNNKVYQNDQKNLKTAHPATFFEDKTNLRLTEEQCNELDKDAIIKRWNRLYDEFPNFKDMSWELQLPIFDTHYQTGIFVDKDGKEAPKDLSDDKRKWEYLWKYARAKDVEKIAGNLHVLGKGKQNEKRNNWRIDTALKGYFKK